MEQEPGSKQVVFLFHSNGKKDLRARFGDLLEEFKRKGINGNITLHFSRGFLEKIHSTKVD